MNNPDDFILTTDYATSKGDGRIVGQVTFPGSTTIPASGYVQRYVDVTVGSRGSIIRSRIASDKDGMRYYSTSSLAFVRSSSWLNLFAFVVRTSPTTIRLWLVMPNAYGSAMTSDAGDETFYFEISTIIPPIE